MTASQSSKRLIKVLYEDLEEGPKEERYLSTEKEQISGSFLSHLINYLKFKLEKEDKTGVPWSDGCLEHILQDISHLRRLSISGHQS